VSEARALAEDRLRELASLPIEELLRFEEQAVEEDVSGPSGASYRVRTDAFWDWDPYDSDLYVQVGVRGRGSRWWQRYGGTHLRGPENDFAPMPAEEPEVSSTWAQNFTCLGLALVFLGLPLTAIYWVIRKLF
jgi:hypothetical protein